MRSPAISTVTVLWRMAMFGTSTATGAWFILAGPDIVLAQSVLPQGGRVVSGQAGIGTPSGNGLTVVQNTSRAVIDWNSFSVGQNGSVNFIQPSASSAILNRVTGSTPSTIAGQVTGNGQVFLVNPNGIAITPSGSVQVGGGFIGSTLDIGNADFNAGNLNFVGKGASAGVSNAGIISSAPGGFVGLIGGSVSNTGTINVPLGKVGLGSGEQVTINPTGDGFLQVAVPTGAVAADGRALIDVAGQIRAAGGTVEIKAATAQQAVRDAVNISGVLSARSVSGRAGNIVLDGGAGGNVAVSGRLSATGGERYAGGTIVVTGSNVRLTSSARLNASGASGGNILVGGDLRGGLDLSVKLVPGTVANARTTAVDQGAVIDANGTTGAGGNAVIWSDISTDFRGTITATGAGTGTGGAVEVSSHGVLGYNGLVDVRSASGKTGTLLLDPFDVTISSGADSNMSGTGSPFSPTGNSSVLSVTTLQNALASANVTVNTGGGGAQNGDITVANAVTWASGNALTLSSARDINVNANIISNGGGLTLTAGRSVNVTNATIDTGGGNLSATASTSDTTTGISLNNATISVGSGTGTLTGSSANGMGIVIAGTSSLSASTGSLSLNGNVTTNSTVVFGSAIDMSANAALTTAGIVNLTGTLGGSAGGHGLTLESNAAITSTGSLTIQGTTTSTASNYNGVYFAGGNNLTASSGNLTVTGTSTSGNGTLFLGADSVTNGGAGTLTITGTSSTSPYAGLKLASGSNLTTSGTMTLSGTETSNFVGLYFENNNSLVNTSGNLTLIGTSASDAGIQWRGSQTITNSGSGTLTYNGTSGPYRGLDFFGNASFTFSGNAALSGTSSGGTGAYFSVNTISVSSGNVTISGAATSGTGALLVGANSFTNSGSGSLALSGTGTTGTGLQFVNTATLNTSGNMTLSGTSSSSTGVDFAGSNTLTDSAGNLALVGTSTSDSGLRIWNANSFVNSGAGSLSLTGSSGNNGLTFGLGASLTTSGDMTLSGTSLGNAVGAYFLGTNSVTDAAGDLTINGTAISASGVFFNTGTSTLTNSGAGTFALNGTSSSFWGVGLNVSVGLTTSGNLTVSGTSSSNTGIFLNGTNNVSDTAGNLTMSGVSTSDPGVWVNSSTNALSNSGAGSFVISGISSSFWGIGLNTNVGLTSTGNLTLSGSSSSSLGMELLGTSSITNSGSGTLTLSGAGGIDLGASITSTSGGPLVLSGNGSITQSAGTISTTDLLLSGASGSFALNAAGNQIGTLAATAMAVAVNDNSALTVGTVLGTAGVTTSGSVTLTTASDLTIASGAPVSGAGPVLAATGAFNNSDGSSAVTATSGRWLIYSSAPGSDTFGALDSANTGLWNATYASLPPGSVTAAGNRYLFANQPTLTVTSTSATKTYGTDVSASIASNYTVSGYQSGMANAYLADSSATASGGAPSVTSAGAGGTATVAGSPYTISAALGSLASTAGYAFAFLSNGQLTVTPASISVTALGGNSTVGASPANPGLSATGLQNGESANVLTGLRNSFGVTSASQTGSYTLSVAGSLTNANYMVTGTNNGSWTVTALPAVLPDGPSPLIPGLSVKPPQNENSLDVLNGLRNASDAVNTGVIPIGALPWTRSVGPASVSPAPIVSSPVSVPAVNPAPVPNAPPAPDGADVAATTPHVDASSNAAKTSSPVVESACAGDNAASDADHSSAEQSEGCARKAKNSAGLTNFALKNLNRKALFGALDRELSDLRNSRSPMTAMLVKAVAVVSVAVTVGLVGWLLRSGALLSALLSTLPLWWEFDPLIVVRRPSRRDDNQQPPTKVDVMFDDAQGLNYSRRGLDS